MTEIAQVQVGGVRRESLWADFIRKDDWWAIWIGLGLVVVAAGLVASGSSLKWLAVAPQKWSHWPDAVAQLRDHAAQYLALFALWATLFGIGVSCARVPDCRASCRCSRWSIVVSLGIYLLGQWDQASHYNLEPPLVALVLGLVDGQHRRRTRVDRCRSAGRALHQDRHRAARAPACR